MPVLEHMRTNELDPDTEAWFISVLEVIESLDVDAYVSLMSPDVEIVMDGGSTRLHGHEQVREGLSRAWAALESIVHDESNIYGSGDRFVHETVTHAVTKDGQHVETPTCVWIDRDADGRILSARIY